ncbi:MAG: glyoxalase/bleomycin resistance/dioxygenase family protein [Verrucomicrobiota bacterium]
MKRRRRLKLCGGMGASLVGGFAEDQVAQAAESPSQVGTNEKGIAELRMKSARLEALQQFYEKKLGLPVRADGDELTVEAGTTRLIFSSTETSENEPFYHYAFNIPENKIEVAREWQKKRTPLLRRGNSEVIHFGSINAHSVYFNDPAGNIVEYIARHDLKNSAGGGFDPEDILYASEIGLVVDDVPQVEKEVKDSLGLKYQRGYRSQSFRSVGDDHALLILVRRNRKWYPNQKQAAKVHSVTAAIRGPKAAEYRKEDLGYHVSMNS